MPTCDDISLLLADYEAGRLSAADTRRVREHLATCPACTHELALQRRLDLAIKQERPPEPGPHMHASFHAWLESEVRAQQAPRAEQKVVPLPWWNRPSAISAFVALAACAVFAFGLNVGARSGGPAAARAADPQTVAELESLREQVSSMRQAVAWTMLQQQSATERLKTVRALGADNAGPASANELLGILAYDTNGSVREGAVQALYRHADAPTVRTAVARALVREPSPAVQLAMIDLLAATRDPEAAVALEEFVHNENQNQLVREAATFALTRM